MQLNIVVIDIFPPETCSIGMFFLNNSKKPFYTNM